jgi:hypothetical protein
MAAATSDRPSNRHPPNRNDHENTHAYPVPPPPVTVDLLAVGSGPGIEATVDGPGGAPHVKMFGGKDLSLLESFFAETPSFTGGLLVG